MYSFIIIESIFSLDIAKENEKAEENEAKDDEQVFIVERDIIHNIKF